ncbi:MAG: hypothetical protein LQ338_007107 [Usnochroma carphineum]|nr:MAG: hypothetical protein LQ338_007107 [Usnochroma carphineum]
MSGSGCTCNVVGQATILPHSRKLPFLVYFFRTGYGIASFFLLVRLLGARDDYIGVKISPLSSEHDPWDHAGEPAASSNARARAHVALERLQVHREKKEEAVLPLSLQLRDAFAVDTVGYHVCPQFNGRHAAIVVSRRSTGVTKKVPGDVCQPKFDLDVPKQAGLYAENIVSDSGNRLEGTRETPCVVTVKYWGRLPSDLPVDSQQSHVGFPGHLTSTCYTKLCSTQMVRGRVRYDLPIYHEVAVMEDQVAEFSREAQYANHDGRDQRSMTDSSDWVNME